MTQYNRRTMLSWRYIIYLKTLDFPFKVWFSFLSICVFAVRCFRSCTWWCLGRMNPLLQGFSAVSILLATPIVTQRMVSVVFTPSFINPMKPMNHWTSVIRATRNLGTQSSHDLSSDLQRDLSLLLFPDLSLHLSRLTAIRNIVSRTIAQFWRMERPFLTIHTIQIDPLLIKSSIVCVE